MRLLTVFDPSKTAFTYLLPFNVENGLHNQQRSFEAVGCAYAITYARAYTRVHTLMAM